MGNLNWMLLVLLGIGTLYPVLFGLAIFFCKLMKMDHGNGMALGYSVAAKNHAITIGIATTAFGGTLAVFPAAVAPIVQIPTMMLYLNLSDRIRRFLQPGEAV
jgi:ACR3 family arsenite efflux pump ArsB